MPNLALCNLQANNAFCFFPSLPSWENFTEVFNFSVDSHPSTFARAFAQEPWTIEFFQRVKKWEARVRSSGVKSNYSTDLLKVWPVLLHVTSILYYNWEMWKCLLMCRIWCSCDPDALEISPSFWDVNPSDQHCGLLTSSFIDFACVDSLFSFF